MYKFYFVLLCLTSVVFTQEITWTDVSSNYTLAEGVKLFKGERTSPKLEAFYIDVDMNNENLAVRPYITGDIATVPVLTKRFGAIAAVNGGYFGGTTSYSAVIYPGEVKAQNVSAVTRNGKSYPVARSMFSMDSSFGFSVDWIYHFGNLPENVYTYEAPLPYVNNDPNPLAPPAMNDGTSYDHLLVGIGGGPVLVEDGEVNITYNEEVMWGSGVGLDNRDPRTALGYTEDNHVILMVADGRAVSSEGLSLPEMAQEFIDLGCVAAMNLDGGGSSQMAVGNQFVNLSQSRSLPVIFAVTHRDSLNLPKTPAYEEIIDTEYDNASQIGEGWFPTANAGYYGTTPALLNEAGTGESYAEFLPVLGGTAEYEVYGWWVASTNRASDTPYIIKHADGEDTVRVDQSKNGSSWQLIGKYNFSGDGSESVIISDNSSAGPQKFVVADAVRFVSYDSTLTNVEEISLVVNEFRLDQNYPNPFNPVTSINYNLSKDGMVKLQVFDVLGRKVETLVDDYKLKGSYSVSFDASELSSGIYFYSLSSAGKSFTRKMTLLK